jgi:Type IV secretion system pilin
MFSTIKSIIKTLSVFSLFATLVVAGLSNVNASADTCADGSITGPGIACRTSAGTTNGGNDLTPPLCGGSTGYKCALISNPTTAGNILKDRAGVTKFILGIASFFIYIASAISVLFIVWGGYNYINAADPKGNESGKKILINALIGLAICILSITIVTFVGQTLDSNLVGSSIGS